MEGDKVRFKRVTIYVDLANEDTLLPTIQACATPLAPECVILKKDDITPSAAVPSAGAAVGKKDETLTPPFRVATTIGLIRVWQAEEADVYTRSVNNTVAFMDASELLITDKSAADGAVAYALYRRQMPVLALRQTLQPARTALQQLLFTTSDGTTVEQQKEAIQKFLTFPAKRGVCIAAPVAAAPSGEAAVGVVVVVNEDGYPVKLPDNTTPSASSALRQPPPPTLFANVLNELYHSGDEHLKVLRQRNPILPGILEAFHRYQNRGVVRAMLHRGYRIEVAPSKQEIAWQKVEEFVKQSESDVDKQTEKLKNAEATLRKFESHWLELPLAERLKNCGC